MTTVRQIRAIADLNYIKAALESLRIDYATPAHADCDFKSKTNRLYALVDNNKIIAICSTVPEVNYNYLAIKRLVILNPNDRGKGYAKRLISTVVKRQKKTCGCTPWADNTPMQKMLASLGFIYQYTFNEVWTFWKKN